MVLGQVVDEDHQVIVETADVAVRDEAEDRHLAIGSLPQLPVLASEVDGRDGLAGGGDGACAAEGAEPDHDLVGWAGGGGAAGEEVVGDVGDDAGAGVGPRPGGLEGRDLGKRDLVDLRHDVGVRLDVVLTARPGPFGVPFDSGAGGAVEVAALRAGAGAGAPEVVVEGVCAWEGG